MSGSGNNGGYSSGMYGGGQNFNCDNYFESVHLSSPNPGVIDSLIVGSVLEVVLSEEEELPSLHAKTKEGEVAGSLIPPSMAKLVQCILDGHSYIANVYEIDGAVVNVEIRTL